MRTGQKVLLGGLAVLAVAGGAYALLRRQPRPQPAPVVTVQTGVTDARVRYQQVQLDLHHLEQGDGFRYHGTVVV
jgi:hypothetical protein